MSRKVQTLAQDGTNRAFVLQMSCVVGGAETNL